MKIVIVGDGKVGFALSAQLSREGHDLTVIDRQLSVLGESSERLDVLTIHGNGVAMQTQREAKVGESDLLIAATTSDETNLLCCLVARKLGCTSTIARVRNHEYAEQLELMRAELGLSMAINPDRAAAHEVFNLLRFPSFLHTEVFAKGRALMAEVRLRADSIYVGKRLRELYDLSKIRALVCVVQRGEETVIPDGNFALKGGDKLSVTAPYYSLHKLIGLFGVENRRVQDVILVGGGRIAYYLTLDLLQAGVGVKIIERKLERCMELSERLPRAIIIHGDGSSQRTLLSEGIEQTDSIVTLTNMDEENLIISMYANYLGVPRVVTKINRTEYNEVFKDKGIDCVVSPKDLTVDIILRYVRSMHNAAPEAMLALHRIAGGAAEAMEFRATEGTLGLGRTLKEVRLKPGTLIACINRRGTTIVPKGGDTIEVGDSVFIVAAGSHKITELNDIFLSEAEGAG